MMMTRRPPLLLVLSWGLLAAACGKKATTPADELAAAHDDFAAFVKRAYPGGRFALDGGVGSCAVDTAAARQDGEIRGLLNARISTEKPHRVAAVFTRDAGQWKCLDDLGRIDLPRARRAGLPPPCAYVAERCGKLGP
jgi:hypothetical protein